MNTDDRGQGRGPRSVSGTEGGIPSGHPRHTGGSVEGGRGGEGGVRETSISNPATAHRVRGSGWSKCPETDRV